MMALGQFSYQKTLIGLFTVLCLAACNEDAPPASPVPQPTASPTSTSSFGNYGGPMIGSLNDPAESQANCTAESGCFMGNAPIAERREDSLPLTVTTVGSFSIGIPEGYSPLELGKEILLTAIASTTEGGYVFSLKPITPEELTEQLARFDTPDMMAGTPIESAWGSGHWVKVADDTAIAVIENESGQILVEAFTYQGFWPAFETTFVAMLESLASP